MSEHQGQQVTLLRPNPVALGLAAVLGVVLLVFIVLFGLDGPPVAEGALDAAIFGAIAGGMASFLRIRVVGLQTNLILVNWWSDTRITASEIQRVSVARGLVIGTTDGVEHEVTAAPPSLLGDAMHYPRAQRGALRIRAWIDAAPRGETAGWERTGKMGAVVLPLVGAVLGAVAFAVVRTIWGVG
jgi:hypothetical protein